MHKTTFNNPFTYLIFFILSINSISIYSQDSSIEIIQQFSSENYAKSEATKIDFKNTSPFVMLSGHTKDLTFSNTVFYRLKNQNTWSEWITIPKPHEGEDIGRVVLGVSFIEQAFEDIQFKTLTPTNSKIIFRLFFPEFTKNISKNITIKDANKQIVSGCAQPSFQGRLDWCPSGDCPKQINPSIINPTHIVVHHSAGNTVSSDYAAVVRSYWDYHVNSRGWADIGYNWLIDPNGVVYEGRGDRVRGAHSPCMNAISTGICFIGDYEGTTQPSTTGMNSLKDMIAWDATDKGIDVQTTGYVAALGGNIETISGHKDGYDQYPGASCTSTACPGANLHNKLQTIRDDVANYSCYISSANAPKTPESFSVIRKGTENVEIKIKSVENATKYGVYKSADNASYQKVTESANTTITIDNLTQGEVTYFKIEAINNDGASNRSTPLAAIPSQYQSDILIIDGVERRIYDAIVQYDEPLTQLGRTFSSATNDAVINGEVNLNDFQFVIWMLLDESTADHTFEISEQTKVKDFIDNGGVFIVSGNEIGWDLVEKGNSTDKSFYENYLKAEYISDNPTPNNYRVKDNNNITYDLSNDSSILNNTYPDVIKTKNGSVKTFIYDGVSESSGLAGVSYQGPTGGVEYLGFAIEGIEESAQRKDLIDYLLQKYSNLLAIDDSSIKQNIRLYPNPTSGIVNISNPNFININKVEIFNIYGQKLSVKKQNNSISLKNFSNGIYFIKIEDENGKQGTFKILKN
ncbi:MAG: N-acetylmuramoyl-L-alanine amidase [Bacteroidota bacterium]